MHHDARNITHCSVPRKGFNRIDTAYSHELNTVEAAMESAPEVVSQQEFGDFDLPHRFPCMQHLCLLQEFSGSNSSIKSNSEIDRCSPCLQGDEPEPREYICEEALEFIRKWESKMKTSSDSIQCQRYVMVESFKAVDFSKPPRRFWRTSWKCMTQSLMNSYSMKCKAKSF
jgi:hypothetical protein